MLVSRRKRHVSAPALISFVMLASASASASTPYANSITGNLADITSIRGALLIRMDDDRVPQTCQGSGTSWMRIDQADTAMVSLMLTYWAQGKRSFVIYVDPWQSGYCAVNQADPTA